MFLIKQLNPIIPYTCIFEYFLYIFISEFNNNNNNNIFIICFVTNNFKNFYD